MVFIILFTYSTYLVSQPSTEQRDRISNIVELITGYIEDTVGCDSKGTTLGVNTEEIQEHQTSCYTTLQRKYIYMVNWI